MPVLSSNGFKSFAITSFSSLPNGAFANWIVTPSYGFARLLRLILGAAAAFPASAPTTGNPTATPAAFLRNSRRLCAAGSGFESVGSGSPLRSPKSSTATSFSIRIGPMPGPERISEPHCLRGRQVARF